MPQVLEVNIVNIYRNAGIGKDRQLGESLNIQKALSSMKKEGLISLSGCGTRKQQKAEQDIYIDARISLLKSVQITFLLFAF